MNEWQFNYMRKRKEEFEKGIYIKIKIQANLS